MKHFYRTIPGWFSFIAIYQQAVKDAKDGDHFVEVGSWKGRSAAFMAVEIINSGKKIRFDCVDTWEGSPNSEKHVNDPAVKSGTLFELFLRNLGPVKAHSCGQVPKDTPQSWNNLFPDHLKEAGVHVFRGKSVDISHLYEAESLDFIFIDANHDYENASADIAAWWPKLKAGGTMAGDDFKWKGVNKAVLEAFFPEVETVWPSRGKGCHWRVRKADDASGSKFKVQSSKTNPEHQP